MSCVRYRAALLLSMVCALLLSAVVVAAAASASVAPTWNVACGPTTRLEAPSSPGAAINGFGRYDSCHFPNGDIGIEVTLSEDGKDVAQRRFRCDAAASCEASVKTSWEPYKKYCVRLIAFVQERPAPRGAAPIPADKQTRCESYDGAGKRVGDSMVF